MDKNDKSKAAKNEGKANEKPATTETQKKNETQKLSDSDKFSDSAVAIEILKKRAEELENNYKRALADYQNLEKRVAEERKEWILKANKNLLLRLLPVLDTLINAAKHVQDEGLRLGIKQFEDVLRAEGVERVETIGKEFDPKFMQCVDVQDGEEGKVIKEARAGYRLGDEALREALVVVGKKNIDKEEEEKAKKELQKGDYI